MKKLLQVTEVKRKKAKKRKAETGREESADISITMSMKGEKEIQGMMHDLSTKPNI